MSEGLMGLRNSGEDDNKTEQSAKSPETPRPDQIKLNPVARAAATQMAPELMSETKLLAMLRLADFVLISVCGFLIYYMALRHDEPEMLSIYGFVAVGASVITVMLMQLMNLYTLSALRTYARSVGKSVMALLIVVADLTALAFFFKVGEEFSRFSLLMWLLSAGGYLMISRVLVAIMVAKWTRRGHLKRRAVIVGGGRRAEELIEALEKSKNTGIEITGVFDDRQDGRSPDEVGDYQKLGNVTELVEFARKTRVDLLIVTLPLSAEKRLLQMLKKLWVLPVDIRLSAHSTRLRFQPRAYSYIGDVPFFDMFDRPLTGWNSILKGLEDRILGSILLIMTAPIMALVALAVKLDSKGPVFFKQKRYGFNNELIEVYKFRSMYTDMTDANAAKLATKDDPRVTRVGRFIRKTSLDELPQFINVVRGELSIVGPRPHAVLASAANHLYKDVVDGYYARHRVKPGVTGWAQINGWRGETDTEEKIRRRTEHDLYYIENWSVFFDLYIIFMTPFSLLDTKNAY